MSEAEFDYSQPSQQRDDATVVLLVNLFDRFCAEEGVDDDTRAQVGMIHFVDWLHANMPLLDALAVCASASVVMPVWNYLDSLINSPQGPLQIQNIWPRVCLAHRRLPNHKLASMHFLVLFTWEDGAICPISCNTPAAVALPFGLTDALCASQLYQQARDCAGYVINFSLDTMHDNMADHFGSMANFDALLDAFVHKIVPQLPAHDQAYATKYVRLIQGLLKPAVPQLLLDAVSEAQKRALSGPEQRGGWSS